MADIPPLPDSEVERCLDSCLGAVKCCNENVARILVERAHYLDQVREFKDELLRRHAAHVSRITSKVPE